MSDLRLQFLLLLLHELSEDLSHTSIHPVNSLTTSLLLLVELLLSAFTFLINTTLEHSSSHLRHLLLLFASDSTIKVIELLFVLLFEHLDLFLRHFTSGHAETIFQVLFLNSHDFGFPSVELLIHQVLFTFHSRVEIILHNLQLVFILSDNSKFCFFNILFLLFLKFRNFLLLGIVDTFDQLSANLLDLLNCGEFSHQSDNLRTFDTVMVSNDFLALLEED